MRNVRKGWFRPKRCRVPKWKIYADWLTGFRRCMFADMRAHRESFGKPVDVPMPVPIVKISREELQKKYPPMVVTKVDCKRGVIAVSDVVDVERCGTTETGAPIMAVGRKR